MGKVIRVAGQDPSLRHWGLASGTLDLDTLQIQIDHLDVIEPVVTDNKQVRQNSKDLEGAVQLAERAVPNMKEAHLTFVEVPHGSQSARAMCGYGVCLGILGTMRYAGLSFIQVSESETKLASVGKKTATKKEMIAWAMRLHPTAPWPMYMEHGKLLVSEAKAEHMADAIAAIYAGVKTSQFKTMLPILAALNS